MRDHPALEILKVDPSSPAADLGLQPGHRLASLNGQRLADEFDYRFAQSDDRVLVEWFDLEGQVHKRWAEKHPDQDLGLTFAETPFRRCQVKCTFCFIDQNPPGMRSSIYFKDEDYRFSFLYGNYVTLFNMSEADMAKAIERRMSPMYISVHTTDETLRSRMLGIRKPTHILERLGRLAEARIEMHAQIVVCPGVNDGANLKKTVHDLAAFHPSLASMACVPVGLTRHRQGLADLRLSTPEEAGDFLDECAQWQKTFLKEKGTRLVFASDEWYLRAGRPLPSLGEYESMPQLANGVGLIPAFMEEFRRRLPRPGRKFAAGRRITAVTGRAFQPFLSECAARLCERVEGLKIEVIGVENRFYGENIGVAGLLTGRDLDQALKGRPLGDEVLLPHVMLRDRSQVFLDDLAAPDLAVSLGKPLRVLTAEAGAFIKACLEPLTSPEARLYDQGPSAGLDRELPEGMFAGSVLR
jgi:putative radical SAM enzyme (TIGR03279 family)